ncbi:MAG TPA: penicillin-insensitive murein endopeptidase [Polyangiaceae bacterium]|nr:penicillin-insensitive murein endopeptidase [Polyangiaceae bacterium]
MRLGPRLLAFCIVAATSSCVPSAGKVRLSDGSPSNPPTAPAASAPPSETATADDEQPADAADSDSDGEAHSDEPEVVDDESEEEPAAPTVEVKRPHPLDGWSQQKIRAAVHENPASLGSMSIGSPNAGALLNGVRADANELFVPVDPSHAYGTVETVKYLSDAVRKVHAAFADTPALSLGHISAQRGGPLRPHVSHQAGRDVDISFYYVGGARWYTRGTESNLDLPRTWALVRALVTETDVDMILIDHSIQQWLWRYAREHGEDAAWVDSLFQGKGAGRPIVRHAPGHATHLHIRFFNPEAQETARRAHPALVAEGIVPPLVRFVVHHAKHGDTLGKIAKKYAVSVAAIREANGLRSNRIREQRDYRIPLRSETKIALAPELRFPPRRLPPASASALGPVSARP